MSSGAERQSLVTVLAGYLQRGRAKEKKQVQSTTTRPLVGQSKLASDMTCSTAGALCICLVIGAQSLSSECLLSYLATEYAQQKFTGSSLSEQDEGVD